MGPTGAAKTPAEGGYYPSVTPPRRAEHVGISVHAGNGVQRAQAYLPQAHPGQGSYAVLFLIKIVEYAKKFYSHLARVNSPDITIEYKNARFFVIKSFSEEDVHKSMKYQVWSSTPEGNKRLNEAYQKCVAEKVPLFLFFRQVTIVTPVA